MSRATDAADRHMLSVLDHDRSFAGFKYVYPVLSRRAGGVSIGINLNPNNACNWRCVYCQVPNLTRGAAPAVDWPAFTAELTQMLDAICHGTYLKDYAPLDMQQLKDFALSGNGEPTSCPDFDRVLVTIGEFRARYDLQQLANVVVITNGSLMPKREVQCGLRTLAALSGEVWFKLDRGSDAALRATNGSKSSVLRQLRCLRIAAAACRTWVQTCWYAQHDELPTATDVDDYLASLRRALDSGVHLAGVQLYTLARKPQLPEGRELCALPHAWMSALATRVSELGLRVIVSV